METLEYKPFAEIDFCIEEPRARQEKGITMFKASLGSGTGSCTVSKRSV